MIFNFEYSDAALCVAEKILKNLAIRLKERLSSALRPRTNRCYTMLFRSLVAFSVCAGLNVLNLNQMHIMSYIEYLVIHGVSAHMLTSHISSCKAKFTMYDLQFHLWDHPSVRYYLKSVKINRPNVVTKKHIIDLAMLNDIVGQCDNMYLGQVFKAVFFLWIFEVIKHFSRSS